jgi:hypothetical protein
MADFQTQNPNLGKFWRALDWKMLIYLEYFTILWNILLSFGIFYYPLEYFTILWNILLSFAGWPDWAIIYFGKWFENYRSSARIWATFYHGTS